MSKTALQTGINETPKTNQAFSSLLLSRVSGSRKRKMPTMGLGQTVSMIREGIHGSVVKEMAEYMPKNILVSVLGTDPSNLSKLYNKRLTRNQTNDINELSILWSELNEFFENDAQLINAWISLPMPALEGKAPAEIMDSGYGRQKIKECLALMMYGDFA